MNRELERRLLRLEARRGGGAWRVFPSDAPAEEVLAAAEQCHVAVLLWDNETPPDYAREWREMVLEWGEE